MKKAERTKKEILSKTASLFNKKGFAGTALSDIVEATGLTKGGIYGNFNNKAELAEQAFNYSVAFITQKVNERTRYIDNTVDKLKTVVYFYRENLFSTPIDGGCPILNTAVEADDGPSPLADAVKTEINQWKERIVHTINKGKDRNEIVREVDAEQMAWQFIGAIEGGLMLSRITNDTAPFASICSCLLKEIESIRKNQKV